MCQFFSFCTDEKGNKYYFNDKQRKTICTADKYEPDSHTSIADYYGFKGKNEDLLNKYEYNPFTQNLVKDTITFEEDYNKILQWCNELDFGQINSEVAEVLKILSKNRQVKIKVPKNKNTSCGRSGVTNKEIGFIENVSFYKGEIKVLINWPESYGYGWKGNLKDVEFVNNQNKNQNIFVKLLNKILFK